MRTWTLNDLDKISEIANKAGSEIMNVYKREGYEIKIKNDQSPLTEADMAAHRTIVDLLKKFTPDIPILSEEGENLTGEVDTSWCVDPLDGTKEFIKRNGEFTVNIALIENYQPIIGVIHIPVNDETFTALRGVGAFKIQKKIKQPLAKQTSEVSNNVIFAVSRSHLNQKTQDYIQQHKAKTISAGSSLKLTLLAEGKADAYPRFGPTSLWDMAAGHAILRETGGEIYTLDNQPLPYNVKQLLNPDLIAVRHKDTRFIMRNKYES